MPFIHPVRFAVQLCRQFRQFGLPHVTMDFAVVCYHRIRLFLHLELPTEFFNIINAPLFYFLCYSRQFSFYPLVFCIFINGAKRSISIVSSSFSTNSYLESDFCLRLSYIEDLTQMVAFGIGVEFLFSKFTSMVYVNFYSPQVCWFVNVGLVAQLNIHLPFLLSSGPPWMAVPF